MSELYLYGVVGEPEDNFDDKSIAAFLETNKNESELNIHINSLGGSVFDGFAIKNQLKSFNGKKTVYIDGLAASAASYIALGCGADEVIMADSSFLMIHPASGVVIGNAKDMREQAEILDKLTKQIAEIYSDNNASKTTEEILEAMNNETWFNAKEAIEYGFNVRCAKEKKANFDTVNKVDLERFSYKHVPEYIVNCVNSRVKPTLKEQELALHSIGLSRKEAKTVISLGNKALKSDSIQRDVVTESDEMSAATKLLSKYPMY